MNHRPGRLEERAPEAFHTRSAHRRGLQSLGRETSVMAVGTVLSRLTGFARLFALSYALGIGHLSDSYNLANNTPNIVYDLVLGGILAATLIPVFVETMAKKGPREAREAMSAVVTVAAVALVVITVGFELTAPWIIGLYTLGAHSPQIATERDVATVLLRYFAPQVALYGMISLVTAVLNARRVFAPPMFVPVMNNLIVIAMLLSVGFVAHHPTFAMARTDSGLLMVLGLGTTAGVAIQALALLPALRESGPSLRWRWRPRHPAVRQVLSLSGWTLGFVIANQIAYFVVLVLATHLGKGAVTAYTYAFIFFQLPYGIVAVSVMSAIQPELALRWSSGRTAAFRRRLSQAMSAILAVVVPAGTGFVILAGPLCALVLGHGAATPRSTSTTAQTLVAFAVGLPGYCAYLLMMRAYQAMQDTRAAFFAYLLENGINIIVAVALYKPLGVPGLALSTSIAYSVSALVAGAHLSRRNAGLDRDRILGPLGRVSAVSLGMAVLVVIADRGVGAATGTGLLLRVVASVGVGVSFFLVASGLAAWVVSSRRSTGIHRSGAPRSGHGTQQR